MAAKVIFQLSGFMIKNISLVCNSSAEWNESSVQHIRETGTDSLSGRGNRSFYLDFSCREYKISLNQASNQYFNPTF